jgi:GT2 family glycosyltransferase
MKDLSVIVVSFNTKDTTKNTIVRLLDRLSTQKLSYEVFIVDNSSTDGSIEMINDLHKDHASLIKPLFLPKNIGFSRANNEALKHVDGRYVLFLNSDVLVEDVDFTDLTKFMDDYGHVGALTVRVVLPTGKIDPASHRGFPTLWRSFCYFTGLEKLFGGVPILNRVVGGYHLLHKDMRKTHDIDSPSGAFFFTRSELMKKLHGFDEDFFMYGEDIDLAYRMKQMGYSIEYIPKYSVTHLKYASGLRNSNKEVQQTIKDHFYNAMKIFYDKHYRNQYPSAVNALVALVIDLRKNLS